MDGVKERVDGSLDNETDQPTPAAPSRAKDRTCPGLTISFISSMSAHASI